MSDSVLDRVRAVIGQVSDSHAAFAARIGMSKDKLSKSLSGARRFTSLELSLIAREAGVTVDWLLSGEAPTALSVAARVQGNVLPDAAAIGELTERYASAYEVLRLVGDHVVLPELASPRSDQPLRRQGDELARAAGELIEKTADAPIEQMDTADLIPAIEEAFGIDIAVQPLPADLHGLAWQGGGRRLVLVAATRNWTRQRFTLAHELGHILFGDAQQPVVDRPISPGQSGDRTEIRANWFAASLLMPANALTAHARGRSMDGELFARLVVAFKVSPSAMAARLDTLGLTDAATLGELRTMTSVQCHQMAGSFEEYIDHVDGSSSPRLPVRIVRSLFGAYERGETTLRPLANILGIPVDDLFDLFAGQPPTALPSVDPETEPTYQL